MFLGRIQGGYRWRRQRKRQQQQQRETIEMPLRKFMRGSKLSDTIIGGGCDWCSNTRDVYPPRLHPVIPLSLVAIAQLLLLL